MSAQRFRRVARALANVEGEFSLGEASADFCIHLLESPNLKILTKLHRKLRFSSKEWIVEFIELRGLFVLLRGVEQLCLAKSASSLLNSLVMSKMVCCIKELLNLKFGMDAIVHMAREDPTSIRMLALGAFASPDLHTNLNLIA